MATEMKSAEQARVEDAIVGEKKSTAVTNPAAIDAMWDVKTNTLIVVLAGAGDYPTIERIQLTFSYENDTTRTSNFPCGRAFRKPAGCPDFTGCYLSAFDGVGDYCNDIHIAFLGADGLPVPFTRCERYMSPPVDKSKVAHWDTFIGTQTNMRVRAVVGRPASWFS